MSKNAGEVQKVVCERSDLTGLLTSEETFLRGVPCEGLVVPLQICSVSISDSP